jgi:hypothetical protein
VIFTNLLWKRIKIGQECFPSGSKIISKYFLFQAIHYWNNFSPKAYGYPSNYVGQLYCKYPSNPSPKNHHLVILKLFSKIINTFKIGIIEIHHLGIKLQRGLLKSPNRFQAIPASSNQTRSFLTLHNLKLLLNPWKVIQDGNRYIRTFILHFLERRST